jgi:hypothetical protein
MHVFFFVPRYLLSVRLILGSPKMMLLVYNTRVLGRLENPSYGIVCKLLLSSMPRSVKLLWMMNGLVKHALELLNMPRIGNNESHNRGYQI